jgi:hypothetical protein
MVFIGECTKWHHLWLIGMPGQARFLKKFAYSVIEIQFSKVLMGILELVL